jgi:Ca2+-transporting ATPase
MDPDRTADGFANVLRGLGESEARRRLETEGFNEIPRHDRRNLPAIVLEILREPMFLLLVAGGAIYVVLGDLGEALILLVFASVSVVISIVQAARTERVLEALRDLTSPRAMVIRDGSHRRIPGRDVVRGDIVALAEGDRVPADAVLRQCRDLMADESLLTGESMAVRKVAATGAPPVAKPGGDGLPYVYSGSLIVRGNGLAEVAATGPRSEIGKIGQSLRSLESEPPRLQAHTRRLVQLATAGAGTVSILALVLQGALRGDWLEALLAAIAIGMAMVPEELPVVLTVFMAMGAARISRVRVLTRRAAAIETLGSATVLCTDKTGTLTENRMSIVELRPNVAGRLSPCDPADPGLAEEARVLAAYGLLASAPEPYDPMERAFHDFARKHADDAAARWSRDWTLVHSYGLRPDLLAVTQAWRPGPGEATTVVAMKGAPETVADLCRLDDVQRAAARQALEAMAAKGLRVLGVARARHERRAFPPTPRDFDFVFLGLVGLADPLRPSVPAAMRECRSAGIRVVMITGDYPATALAIAREAGLGDGGAVIGGDILQRLSDAELRQQVRTATVFARIMPDQKLRIVQALKSNGEIVAMTGDGVNDAPSLKAAHIGIAMGGRGTDVAREASAMVLLDDDFGSIVAAIRLGRRIYDNLRKAMGFIFAVHVPIAGLALLPLVLGMPIIFGPIHIAFLELIIDPVCSLAFEGEPEEEDVMRRPPRPPAEPVFTWPLVAWSILQGLLVLAITASIFVVASRLGMDADKVRALTFVSLVSCVASIIFVNRSFTTSLAVALRRSNAMLTGILAATAALLAAGLLMPTFRGFFHFGALGPHDLGWAFGAAAAVLVVLELAKAFWRDQLRF